MLGEIEYTMNQLFKQLGLESSDEAILSFIKAHQLPEEVELTDAPFWTDTQRAFIKEEYRCDAVWSSVLDELNVELHQDNMQS